MGLAVPSRSQADPSGSQFDDLTLWDELAALAIRVTQIRGDRSTRITPDVLARSPGAPRTCTCAPSAAGDVLADQPLALARQLNRLLAA